MKTFIQVLILVLCLQSCDIKKRAIKNKTDRTLTEATETITKRKGDTVSYIVPKITYRDTTIYTVNRQGTTLKTVYDNTGNISQIDCMSSLIDLIERTNKRMDENIKSKDQQKEEKFDSIIILYIMLGLALIVIVVAFFGFRILNKHGSAISTILKQIT